MLEKKIRREKDYAQLEGDGGGRRPEVDIRDDDTPKGNPPAYNPDYYGNIGSFKPSAAYTQAMAYTNSLLDKINSGKTSYSDKINALMSQIEGREKFSYDFNTDPLFQNALQGAMSAGQTAMQDTIGQASALTGGYGSSYATSAANQTYNQFVKGAYDALPDYYALAKNAYDQEGQELYDRLGMYRTADDTEYGRLGNAYNLNLANAESLYGKEYNNYWDTAKYNLNVAQMNNDLKYKMANLAENQRQYNLNLEEEKRQFNAKNGGSSGYVALTNDVRKALENMADKYGFDEGNELWQYTDYLEDQGYDRNEMAWYINSLNIDPQYKSDVNGIMTDKWGKQKNLGLAGNPAAVEMARFELYKGKEGKADSIYKDQYGNEYTYQQVQEILKNRASNTKGRLSNNAQKNLAQIMFN